MLPAIRLEPAEAKLRLYSASTARRNRFTSPWSYSAASVLRISCMWVNMAHELATCCNMCMLEEHVTVIC